MMKKRSISLSGHRTSVLLEDEFWDCLSQIAAIKKMRVSKIIEQIDQQRPSTRNLASAIRLFILNYYMNKDHSSPSDQGSS